MAFQYPSFLFALAAIAVPVILHLVQLRRAKRVVFSNVKFIQASKDLTASQRNLKELLILLCRVAFIAFLVLAFAQPFLPASDAVTHQSDVAIVLDNSYSMQNVHAEKDLSLLTTAADQAKAIVNLFPASTAFSIGPAGGTTFRTPVEGTDAAAYFDRVDFSAKASLAVSGSNKSAGHVFVLSDFQKNNAIPSIISRYDSAAQIHLLPFAAAANANVAIDSVYLEDEFIRPAVDNALHVRVVNTGAETREDVPLKLFIENTQVAALSMDLPPHQATEAVLNFRMEGTGLKKAYVQVEDFPVEFDNTYYFVLAPSATINIMEVTSKADSPLRQLYSNEPFFNFSQYAPASVDYARLASTDIIVLNGVQEISPALAASVASNVKAGSTALVIPDAQSTGAGMAALTQALNIAASLGAPPQADNKTKLLAPDPNKPFFRGIFSDFDAKMQMPSAVRQVSWSRATDDILKFRGGAPFLSRFDRGNGQVYLMAAPLAADYNTLAHHALFVPVMYKLALSSHKQEQQLAYTLGEGAVQVPVQRVSRRDGVYVLQQDSLALIPEQQVRGNKLSFNLPADMDKAGFYTLQLQDSALTSLAFNYDKKESYLEQYSPDELRALTGNRQQVHVYDYGDAFSVKGEFEKRYFGVKLWKYCLILCLFFLMAEIALIRLL